MFFPDEPRFMNTVLEGDHIIYAAHNESPSVGSYNLRGGKYDPLGFPTPSRSRRSTMDQGYFSPGNRIRSGIIRNGIFFETPDSDIPVPGPGSYVGGEWCDHSAYFRSPRQVISRQHRWKKSSPFSVLRNDVLFIRGEVELHKDKGSMMTGFHSDPDPILHRSFNVRVLDGNASRRKLNDESSGNLSQSNHLRRSKSFGSRLTYCDSNDTTQSQSRGIERNHRSDTNSSRNMVHDYFGKTPPVSSGCRLWGMRQERKAQSMSPSILREYFSGTDNDHKVQPKHGFVKQLQPRRFPNKKKDH